MQRLMKLAALGALVVLAGPLGCEDSDLIAPSDGQIIVEASPANVTIDPEANQTSADSVITALVLDSDGFPLGDITVNFFATGGTLASQTAQGSMAVETNDSGVAIDTLTLTLNDPDTVDVTVRSSALSGVTTVTKDNLSINEPPEALAIAIPANQAQLGQTVIFDGSASSDPDSGDVITCYKWTLSSSVPIVNPGLPCNIPSPNCEVVQGPGRQTVTKSSGYADLQLLNIELQVTDNPLANPVCNPSGPAADLSGFTTDTFIIAGYDIVCVNNPPIARAGTDRTVSTGQTVTLDGGASTDDTGIASFSWSCGNNDPDQNTQVAMCSYAFPGTFTATLTVVDNNVACPGMDTDTVTITVVP